MLAAVIRRQKLTDRVCSTTRFVGKRWSSTNTKCRGMSVEVFYYA